MPTSSLIFLKHHSVQCVLNMLFLNLARWDLPMILELEYPLLMSEYYKGMQCIPCKKPYFEINSVDNFKEQCQEQCSEQCKEQFLDQRPSIWAMCIARSKEQG